MHRLIVLNALNGLSPGHGDLVICMEQVLGPTIQDDQLARMREQFLIDPAGSRNATPGSHPQG
ncbi:MAG: hypothetical protein EOP85_18980 [Verrucomicrobiaceae bacterium]|nr:MAG: hypothetical protein EOP85_18980 [Verrucomicrobiaceae bacterium]